VTDRPTRSETNVRNAVKDGLARQGFASLKPTKRATVVFLVGAVVIYFAIRQMYADRVFEPDSLMIGQLIFNLLAVAVGFIIGLVPLLFTAKARDLAFAMIALVLLALMLLPGSGTGFLVISGIFGLALGLFFVSTLLFKPGRFRKPTTFGSAEWASADDITHAGLTHGDGFFLGAFEMAEEQATEIHYPGDRHLLTVAPTRAGKGVSAIVPNLLSYEGSTLVIDPKGENALITAGTRQAMGHDVRVVDPWNLAAEELGSSPARFNPIDWLKPDDPDFAENAMLLAEALVVPSGGDNKFWDEEAKGLLFGLLLYLATEERERDTRTLGRMRELLTLSDEPIEGNPDLSMPELLARMSTSDHPLVRSSANRFVSKADRERASVLSSAQAQTHFLDSPRIRESLSTSDFAFEDLKTSKLSVYLVLPSDRLDTFGRWLRLLIQQAITVNARNIAKAPDKPVLFMLDEMPALGHLKMVEQAYGLMAGFGIQLWGIVQDLSQLKRIYGDGWETFIGNSGVLQYFGSRDQMTAEYFSKLCGVTTINSLSESIAEAISSAANGGRTTTTTTSAAQAQRNLAYPDELMRLADERQLLLVQNHNPIAATKVRWFEHPTMKTKGRNLRDAQVTQDTA